MGLGLGLDKGARGGGGRRGRVALPERLRVGVKGGW